MFYYFRLIEKDGIYRIYYSTENSKEYHEYEPQFLEIDAEFVPGIQKIIISYPNFICVKELPIENDVIKVLSIFIYLYCMKNYSFKND